MVTESSRLAADLNCSGDAITIAANNVTLDLNGHSITGPGNTTATTGIKVSSRSGVVIVNGSITGFGSGVFLEYASYSRVEGVDASGNGGGIELASSSHNEISHNSTTDNRPAPGSEANGIALDWGSHDNLIEANEVSGNAPWGIFVVDDSDNNTVVGNHVFDNDVGIAIYVGGSTGNLVERNLVLRNAGTGINADAGNTLTRNIVIGNAKISTAAGSGINGSPGVIDGGGNVAANNAQRGDVQCANVVCLGPGPNGTYGS